MENGERRTENGELREYIADIRPEARDPKRKRRKTFYGGPYSTEVEEGACAPCLFSSNFHWGTYQFINSSIGRVRVPKRKRKSERA